MSRLFLFEKVQSAIEFGQNFDIPKFILNNLSPAIKVRDYQKDAIKYTLAYLQGPTSKNIQTHLLYHMATGSGKTLIMAMDILYYFSLGYRNFLFFTNQTSIVSKTKINFLKKTSKKYLFSNQIHISSRPIKIKEVPNFQKSDPDAINICFTTIQSLHSSLLIIKENSITIDDFKENKVVLIADEAHHLNAATIKDSKTKKQNQNWEDTIFSIFQSNKDNVLLEFTATCDLKDSNVLNKYLNKIIYNFTLREFREAGYTKEFANVQTNADKWTRTLQALIMSEYRKLKFEENNINAKPVVLLKSKTIKESDLFYENFNQKIKSLSAIEIEEIMNNNKNIDLFKNAFQFLHQICIVANYTVPQSLYWG
jgi:type III restriction enzyme